MSEALHLHQPDEEISQWRDEEIKQWRYKGLKCMIKLVSVGWGDSFSFSHFCGYTKVPSYLVPTIARYVSEETFSVHGGVTFYGHFHHNSEIEEDIYWLGFDTAHHGDKNIEGMDSSSPSIKKVWEEKRVIEETENLAEQILSFVPKLERKINETLGDQF